jgi:hypothetical protein
MQLWGKGKPNSAEAGGDFEAAAARVTVAEQVSDVAATAEAAAHGDRLEIRPEWAEAAARLCFLPAARLSHPAYALTDEEAQTISPQIQALLQAVADKYAPALVGRVASRHPELFDAVAALGVLYWQKWRYVSKLQAAELAEAAAKADGEATPPVPAPVISLPVRPKVGERDETGALVI